MFHFGYLTPDPEKGKHRSEGILRCRLCGSFLVKKHGDLSPRFQCLVCGNTFSVNDPLPFHEGQSRRIDTTTQAQIAADRLLAERYSGGKSVDELAERYAIAKRTVRRIVSRFRKKRMVYVWRNPTYTFAKYVVGDDGGEEEFPIDVRREGRLYHDYGWEDLRKGPYAFVEAGLRRVEDGDDFTERDLLHLYDYLKIMLVMKRGDYVVVPNYRDLFSILIAELKGGYGFDPKWGHYVEVERAEVFEPRAEDYNYDVQRLAQIFMPVSPQCGFESLFRMFPVVAVGSESRTFTGIVRRLME